VDSHVVATLADLKLDDVSSLLLVEVLREDIGALSVSLTPLLSLSVKELQAEDTLAELVHHRAPEHDVDLVLLPAEERVDVWELAEEEAASVSSTLLV